MSCKYCEDLGQYKGIYASAWEQRAADDEYEVDIPVNFCPNCGEPLTDPEPLTLDELRKIDGNIVWVKILDVSVFADKADAINGWGLVRHSWARVWDDNRPSVRMCHNFDDYGKTWLAYRCEPKGDT